MSRRERLRIDDGDERQVTRQRRGRLISCPNCMRTSESMMRFQLRCPRCGHTWEEPSGRNLIDWLREQPANLAGGLMWVVPAAWLLAFVLAIGYLLGRNVDEWSDVVPFAPIVAVLFFVSAAILVMGKSREPPHR